VSLNGYALGSGRDARPTGQNYTYYTPPTVLSVLPQAGVFSGGTVVTLLGQVTITRLGSNLSPSLPPPSF
jgi:hypothetical protein